MRAAESQTTWPHIHIWFLLQARAGMHQRMDSSVARLLGAWIAGPVHRLLAPMWLRRFPRSRCARYARRARCLVARAGGVRP